MDIHDVSNYDYHFIIKQLAEEFEKQFECLGENTQGDIHTFSMAIESQRNRKTIKCLIRTRINPNLRSVRFRASSLSSLTDNLVKVLYKGKSNE